MRKEENDKNIRREIKKHINSYRERNKGGKQRKEMDEKEKTEAGEETKKVKKI
jgi:hypothetical protein